MLVVVIHVIEDVEAQSSDTSAEPGRRGKDSKEQTMNFDRCEHQEVQENFFEIA